MSVDYFNKKSKSGLSRADTNSINVLIQYTYTSFLVISSDLNKKQGGSCQ